MDLSVATCTAGWCNSEKCYVFESMLQPLNLRYCCEYVKTATSVHTRMQPGNRDIEAQCYQQVRLAAYHNP